ncbi:hypothetical protein [Pseudonocardia humida]|uniref:Uncharacterized protein n=1 Tax=Pseudonocardia humida TaxID=2800819 RepID=A0ABT1A7M4_9PSEU|nr:hypothetical protein [Pseudonocardia humida]MCO1659017.1 hypothetical protein [Pseudonocardia humida]
MSPTTMPPTTPTRWSTRRQIAVFLLVAFATSWLPWPPTLLNPTSAPLLPVWASGCC